MNLKSFITISATLAAIVGLPGCNVGVAETTAPPEAEQAVALPVSVATPERVELFATYRTTANLGSDIDAPIAARVQGEVVELLVEEGDTVSKGQVLARLDGDRLRIRLAQAKANFEMTRREYERFINLHARGLVSTASVDDKKFELDSLAATYELTKLNYEYTNIRSTISGVVADRHVKIGQHVNEGDALFRVTQAAELLAYLQIPQSELGRLSAGHAATVQVDSMPEHRFAATVARVSPTIDSRNGSFRATIAVDNTAGLIVPGMFGRFEIAYEKHEDAVVIPLDAVVEEDNATVVYIVENGAAVRKPITTGIEENGRIEITEGLTGDERVIVTGQNGLRDGSKVLASAAITAQSAG